MPTGVWKRTQRHRELISKGLKEWRLREPLSLETRKKIGDSNRGKKRSLEVIKAMSLVLQGRTAWNKGKKGIYSKEYRKKLSDAKRKGNRWIGENNPRWHGGVTPLTEAIRKLPEYRQWRKAVFKKDNYTCRLCGKRGRYKQAHHVKPFKEILDDFLMEYNQFSPIEDQHILIRLAFKYPVFWRVSNGVTLCKKCHEGLFN